MNSPITQAAQITQDVIAAVASAHNHTAPAWTAGFLLDTSVRRRGLALQALEDAMRYPRGSVARGMRLRDAESWMADAIQCRNNAIGFASK
ncbi:hypothetical protein UFOVP469_21 [uncultured Caudovirales phage]|uniref:Uncharacterized protein n=1 Tax=uncultured Caudovirales phage TaxID=2100421 RepID=A0A6J5MCG0_9CAUD|nr:hypothetical protein UFOVP469_21 [uncultured Caudovirales phage]CAB4190296.1 hypothetical protein UFOVP1200_51 [uncultured Caudovirales phage]